uniref:Uncharacterized protein n=1 Tax=Proteus vulgaris TaxID=585 RepID=Q8KK68_PROVU|nr:hypothetical protein [Proteus vulgaris]
MSSLSEPCRSNIVTSGSLFMILKHVRKVLWQICTMLTEVTDLQVFLSRNAVRSIKC